MKYDRHYLPLKEIQFEEKKMLKILISFLETNKINYFLMYGSLLGAVRHKGFIPWDDDIDIVIKRPEYNKLIFILKKNPKIIEGLEFIGFELNNNDFPFLKLINKNIYIEEAEKCDNNLWIDIFPLDGYPKIDFFYCKKIGLLRNLYFIKRAEIRKLDLYDNNTAKKIIMKAIKFIRYDLIIKKYIKYCSKYDITNSKYIACNIWGIKKKKFKKELFEEINIYDFEDLKVIGPKKYDDILSLIYGNYMILPSKEKRITHSFRAWKD